VSASTARALMGTVIVVGTPGRLADAAEALEQLGESTGVLAILISEGKETAPTARVTDTSITIKDLAPQFLNNAVAGLRLSSLPAVVWWRGGSIAALDDLADLADRLVLDVESPDEAWRRVDRYFDRTALTDLRWARLTRWRSALAHTFDLPQVREAVSAFERLSIEATDTDAARLFAGWLRTRLRWTPAVKIEITRLDARSGDDVTPMRRVTLDGANVWISIDVKPESACLAATVDGVDASVRIVPLGDGTLASLIAEELGVRTRDFAFEQAVTVAREIRV